MSLNLAEFTKKRRAQLGLSQAGLAQASKGKLKPVTVCDIEMGRSRDIPVSTVLALAKALRVRPDIIIAATRETLEPKQKEPTNGQEAQDD